MTENPAPEVLMPLIDNINAQLEALKLHPLNTEQVECLRDPARLDEAAGMLNDLAARCGVRLPLPEGEETGPFMSEDEAREEAEEQAKKFDAVALDAMATDDGRSYGNNEYSVIAFSGPYAAPAAACRAGVTYWVRGEQH